MEQTDKRPSPPAPKGARPIGTGTYVGPIKDLAGETALLITDPDDKVRLYAQFDYFDLEHPMKPGQLLSHGWTPWNRKHWEIDEYATQDLPDEKQQEERRALTDEEARENYGPQFNL